MAAVSITQTIEDIVAGRADPRAFLYGHPTSESRFTRPQPSTATIYFVGPVDGPIKIGWASRINVRLRDLRMANAFPLSLWASVSGAPSLEREYHKRFAAHRLHGEWFDRHPDILAEIDRLNGGEA
jgi:hypothetical protein